MRVESSSIPTSSQTVGPYFRIGLEYLLDRTPSTTLQMHGTIQICGRVLDRDSAPVPDAVLEFWSATAVSHELEADKESNSFPLGFRRVITDTDGVYSVSIEQPSAEQLDAGGVQAPHMLVLVFARGLLRHLITRVYLGHESVNQSDPVLTMISEERRHTLIARPDASRAGLYEWDVILQGPMETVFFAW